MTNIKFNLAEGPNSALVQGLINLYKLKTEDQFVLVITPKNKDGYIIPLLKDKTSTNAYISDEYSKEEYNLLALIITEIFEKAIYKDMYTYLPIRGAAPEFDKTVLNYIKASGGLKSTKSDGILLANGYDLSALSDCKIKKTSRDYSELLKDPQAKDLYNIYKEMVDAIGIKYEDLDDDIKSAYNCVMNGESDGIIFTGPTGTGKSFACRVLAVTTPAPLMNIQITDGTTVEDLLGMFVPNDDASSDSKFKFVPGPLLLAYTKGYQLVIEEVNYGQPGIIAVINQFTDSTPYVNYDGKLYKRHPNFVCYMTMNPGYAGTGILNPSLKGRFGIVNVPALSESEFCKRNMDYSKMLGHQLSAEFFTQLYGFANFIEKEGSTSRWHEDIKLSIRNSQRLCDSLLHSKCTFKEFKAAISVQYLNNLSIDNDNSAKLQQFKESDEINNMIKNLYDLYDFSEITTTECDVDFGEFFTEVLHSSSDKTKDKMIDDLFSKFEEK